MTRSFEIREYTENGHSPYTEWFESLDNVAAERVDKYIRRLEVGNFGASKSLRGVFELRMDFGPGYRVYFARQGTRLLFCLAAEANGDKQLTLPLLWSDGIDIGR